MQIVAVFDETDAEQKQTCCNPTFQRPPSQRLARQYYL